MTADLDQIRTDLLAAVDATSDHRTLEAIRADALAKDGQLTALICTLADMPPEDRTTHGLRIHALRGAVSDAIVARRAVLEARP